MKPNYNLKVVTVFHTNNGSVLKWPAEQTKSNLQVTTSDCNSGCE